MGMKNTNPQVDTQDEQLRNTIAALPIGRDHLGDPIYLETIVTVDEANSYWDDIESLIKAEIRKAEEKGYVIGFNACVDDCPDKMSTEPYGAEEVK